MKLKKGAYHWQILKPLLSLLTSFQNFDFSSTLEH